MTKRLLVAFLSIFMLKATITAAQNDDEQGPARKKEMCITDSYITSTVSPEYQEKIEKYLKKYGIPYTFEFFTQEINYYLFEKLFAPLGLSVPDEIAYGDTYRKIDFNHSVGKYCPPTPRVGYYERTDPDGKPAYWKKKYNSRGEFIGFV